ncbi:cytochrome P460 family protein [Pelagibacterium xiamenense]|uniref:cytochrome P460 family protein n=1 Tax=Pelagibacterium xiamenense TaxID=2901140 RepID=UPI001E286664|nr:cytochrome P460 family protein [Pelagibacterium xiamenense]MCD7059084.1 cytochrome P460 family protein [Pelagibacterium xiamenense]
MGPKLKLGAALIAVCAAGGGAVAQDAMFGTEDDVDMAAALWQAMIDARLAGEGAIHTLPYAGTEPHGAVLETFYMPFEMNGQEGQLIVKRNHMAEGLTPGTVWDDPDAALDAITVMFEQPDTESGWFWAKYFPDGSLDQTPDGVSLAGQAAGCIGCHSGAADGDMVFAND